MEINVYGDSVSDNPKVKLPLLTWKSFKEQNISLARDISSQDSSLGVTKKELFCVVEEKNGTPIEIGTPIKFIENSVCNYTYYRPPEEMPNKRELGLVKIKIIKTGEEVWTWRTAVENISN